MWALYEINQVLHTPDRILAFLTFRKQRTRRGWVLSRVQDEDVAWRNENSIMTSPMRGHWFALQTDRWLFYKNQIRKNWISGQTWPNPRREERWKTCTYVITPTAAKSIRKLLTWGRTCVGTSGINPSIALGKGVVESSPGQMSSTGISGYTREKKITSAKSAKRYVLENYAKVKSI